MDKVKKAALWLEAKLHALLAAQMPVIHTAWQTALSALVVSLLAAKSTADVRAALIAAGAVFLAALKATYLKSRG